MRLHSSAFLYVFVLRERSCSSQVTEMMVSNRLNQSDCTVSWSGDGNIDSQDMVGYS